MEFTGERMIVKKNKEDIIYLEHLVRYISLASLVKNKKILDIACGSGYGSDLLSSSGAKRVYGVDVSKEAIEYCRNEYKRSNLFFLEGDASKIPLGDDSVDVVISFETIEHISHEKQLEFLSEIKRVLRKNGILVISTPNPRYSNKDNHFHIGELSKKNFYSILGENFKNIDRYTQKNSINSEIIKTASRLEKKFSLVESSIDETENFYIAICSGSGHHFKIEESSVSSSQILNKLFKDFKELKDIHEKRIIWTKHLEGDIKKLNIEINRLRGKKSFFRRKDDESN